MNDAAYYNAIAIALFADYAKIARVRGSASSWKDVWDARPELHRVNPEAAWKELQARGIALILHEDDEYPSALKEIAQPPFALYIKGALPKKGVKMLAIVGTRRATAGGKDAARTFAETLGRSGWCIVSGLALGVDGAAHAGALEVKGATLAVMACGLDTVYPSEHASLAERILNEGGALISEYPIGGETLPYRFLERNRIVSGLARGALIIEAPERSGSLATAKFALDQNREVFVTPGPLTHPNFAGSHALIKAGAALVTTPDDIRLAFGEDVAPKSGEKTPELSGDERLVYETLKATTNGATIDKLAETANLPSYVVSRVVTFLQLKGIIRESAG
ncbi:MAG: DNA-protecting protein DprA, partial [Candidatus Colwellbacteria bacterium]|nr:DNA-protecting protein DprA [Candidatus Colwellbacteria bacterium]